MNFAYSRLVNDSVVSQYLAIVVGTIIRNETSIVKVNETVSPRAIGLHLGDSQIAIFGQENSN